MVYSLALFIYELLLKLIAPFHQKASKLIAGRKNTFVLLHKFKRSADKKLAWFHCASLGEFEQARPVIEVYHNKGYQIAVSFYSPSGYDIRKNYELADLVFYLPNDTTANAENLIRALQPQVVFIVKYEIWLRLISTIKKYQIDLYLLSATFRSDQRYFKWYGRAFFRALQQFDAIFTQDKDSLTLLNKYDITQAYYTDDTRYDRVMQTVANKKQLRMVEAFVQQSKVIIAGSSYASEEKILADWMVTTNDIKLIIAPHHINATRIAEVQSIFNSFPTITWSVATTQPELLSLSKVLIIDNIGLLASLYAYGNIAFVGGGFGTKGIHNTLEAAAFGLPVIIGPNNHERFPEVNLLKNAGALFSISSPEEASALLNQLFTNNYYQEAGKKANAFVVEHSGATAKVIHHTAP